MGLSPGFGHVYDTMLEDVHRVHNKKYMSFKYSYLLTKVPTHDSLHMGTRMSVRVVRGVAHIPTAYAPAILGVQLPVNVFSMS